MVCEAYDQASSPKEVDSDGQFHESWDHHAPHILMSELVHHDSEHTVTDQLGNHPRNREGASNANQEPKH